MYCAFQKSEMLVVCMSEIRNTYKISVGNAKGKRRHTVIRKRTVNSNHVAQNKGTIQRAVLSANSTEGCTKCEQY